MFVTRDVCIPSPGLSSHLNKFLPLYKRLSGSIVAQFIAAMMSLENVKDLLGQVCVSGEDKSIPERWQWKMCPDIGTSEDEIFAVCRSVSDSKKSLLK
jgi:hypothetical protein